MLLAFAGVRGMLFPRLSYRVLLTLALFRFGYALRRGRSVLADTAPSMRDVREIAKAAEAAGLVWRSPSRVCCLLARARQGVYTCKPRESYPPKGLRATWC